MVLVLPFIKTREVKKKTALKTGLEPEGKPASVE